MRAHTITTMSRRRRRARRRAIALVLAICSLAIPAGAAAYSSPNAITGGSEQSSQPPGGSDHSSVNAITGGSSASSAPSNSGSSPSVAPGYSSLNATAPPPPGEPAVLSSSPSTDDGFDWSSAAVGAGAAMALLALGGAAFLTVRRQRPARPSPAGTS
jgi:hypothetical protein